MVGKKKTDAEGEECALWGAVSVSDVLEVSDGPSSDNNLAIHGRPNRFILTRRSACVCVRGEGWGCGHWEWGEMPWSPL